MSFLWPDLLWLMLLAPLPILLRLWLDRRRRRDGLGASALARMHTQAGIRSRWRRRLPALLLLLALGAMLLAVARPTARLTLPSPNEVVVLAIDVSGSMNADDVEPTRLLAAQQAARSFVASLPSRTRVSIVSFASSASIVLPPTRNRVDIESAFERLQTQPGTAVGSAILIGLKALFPDIDIDMRSRRPRVVLAGEPAGAPTTGSTAFEEAGADDSPRVPEALATEAGATEWGAIVLLTDGQTNAGADPVESAKIAAALGIRVFPVGFGTPDGVVLESDGWSMRVRLDDEILQEIADLTLGDYAVADTALDLRKVYDELSLRLSVEAQDVEITGLLSALGLLLLLLSAGLSLRWFNRVV
ncbi:MAG: VWA domain-containing protein [Burkholderiaceae bacterium]